MTTKITPNEVVAFWRAAGPSRWYKADPMFDRLVRLRLGAAYEAAARGELGDWAASPVGALALLILLDQAPRNIFRGTPRAFATDAAALAVADTAIQRKFDRTFGQPLRQFFYLPFMHSEQLADQERCVALMAAHGGPENLRYAEIHRDVIARFGRFPHRNPILGRTPRPDEEKFLADGGFRG
jgi:uncharacterized protein (DUF924 family)